MMYRSIKTIINDIKKEITILRADFYGIITSIKISEYVDDLFIVEFIDDTCTEGEKLNCNIFSFEKLEWRIGDIVFCDRMKVYNI
jgi:hypothetical protein